ncbi:MAG: hypothetical protein U0T81_17395 [Saprospiraceae bacterium]
MLFTIFWAKRRYEYCGRQRILPYREAQFLLRGRITGCGQSENWRNVNIEGDVPSPSGSILQRW